MNNSKQIKMESPARIKELNPKDTLRRIGLGENDVICDIGAGTGIFTMAAAQITNNKIYALEIDDEMLKIIDEKAKSHGASNIEIMKVKDNKFDLADHTVDLALMVTVLHEIENKEVFLKEIKRLVKNNGRIMVIEFHKQETPMGPPVPHRISKDEVKKAIGESGFRVAKDFDLGDDFFCLLFNAEANLI
jgi:ubiquinone/menaquinone biosynthesis C-methylase UbiE